MNHGLPLESAEGCYSLAAASDPSLKIKFTVKVNRAYQHTEGDERQHTP